MKFTSIDLNSISDVDRNVLLTLSDNAVPYEWRKLWQGPKLASEYLKSVAVRVQTVSNFVENLDEPINDVDFSKIFNVDSFLSTVKLETSRELKVSTSSLALESFTEEAKYEKVRLEQKNIVKVAPLLIDGLSFENNRLAPSDSSSTNLTTPIYIFFKESSTINVEEDKSTFAIPLYATHFREKLLCTIKLNTLMERDQIIYSGTSLVVPAN